MAKQRLKIPATAQNPKNQHVLVPKAIDDEVLAHGKASQARAQIIVPPAPDIWIFCEEEKSLRNGVDKAVGDLDASTLRRNIMPNAVEVEISLRAAEMSH